MPCPSVVAAAIWITVPVRPVFLVTSWTGSQAWMYALATGFPVGSGNTVVLVRKSFLVCVDYAADTGGGTSCR